MLIYRVTKTVGAGVLRGTRAYGVLARSASSALAPVSTSKRHCSSLHRISIQSMGTLGQGETYLHILIFSYREGLESS
jgi:hypothetical protein